MKKTIAICLLISTLVLSFAACAETQEGEVEQTAAVESEGVTMLDNAGYSQTFEVHMK